MVSRQEDIGSTTIPLTMLIMAPYFLVIFFNDNPLVLTIMSYVPFSAPVGMPMRLFLGEAQWWEPILVSLAILIATCVGAILVGARIYQNSLLRMGARVKLRRGAARLTDDGCRGLGAGPPQSMRRMPRPLGRGIRRMSGRGVFAGAVARAVRPGARSGNLFSRIRLDDGGRRRPHPPNLCRRSP